MSCPVSPGAPPSTSTVPPDSGTAPSTALIRVDLPDPFGPRTATKAPGAIDRSTSDQTSRPPSRTEAWANRTAGPAGPDSATGCLQCIVEGVQLTGLPRLEGGTRRLQGLGDPDQGDALGPGPVHLGLHVGSEG